MMRPEVDQELARTNRRLRNRHIENLKALVRENKYRVNSEDIADGILGDTKCSLWESKDR